MHRPDEHQVGSEQFRELGKRRALAREVSPQGEDDDRSVRISGGGDNLVDEPAALPLVLTDREKLLKLVDDEDEPLVSIRFWDRQRIEGGDRVRAGAHDDRAPALAAWQETGSERRQ